MNKNDFATAVKFEVANYLKQREKIGNSSAIICFILISLALFTIYYALLFVSMESYVRIPLLILMGMTMTLAGVHIMHEGTHGNLFKTKKANLFATYLYEIILCFSSEQYKLRHVRVHHKMTNLKTMDYDLDTNGLLRLSPHFPKKKFHRFQWLYFPFLYCIGILFISYLDDLKRLAISKVGEFEHSKWSLGQIISQLLFKALHVYMFIIYPLKYFALADILSCYLLVYFIGSFGIAMIFQVSHVNSLVDFPDIMEDKSDLTYQMLTTANYAPNSKLVLFLTGGVNLQIEHHLFPSIPFRELSEIQKIVKKTAHKFSVPYYEFDSYFSALKNHIRFLRFLGNKKD